MTWGMYPRKKSFLWGLIKTNFSPKRAWRNRKKGILGALVEGTSVTADGGPVSFNSRTRRIRTNGPFGIFHLGKKR